MIIDFVRLAPSPLRSVVCRFSVLALSIALALSHAGCAMMSQSMRADYTPRMRYNFDPEVAGIATGTDARGRRQVVIANERGPIQRPWVPVGVFASSAFVPLEQAGRLLGCDVVIRNTVQSAVGGFGSSGLLTMWREGEYRGVRFGLGDQICGQYTDADAQRERRASEGSWVWTAYQRPPVGGGWAINFALDYNLPINLPNGVTSVGMPMGGTFSIEKWLRAIPLGFHVRFSWGAEYTRTGGTTIPTSSAVILPGAGIQVPLIALWRVQLAAVGLFEVGISTRNGGAITPRFAPGAWLDFVGGRICCTLGAGFEYWINVGAGETGAPFFSFHQGPTITGRFGFAF